jgi:formylglycine-generating enzyme required for sulfatase activity
MSWRSILYHPRFRLVVSFLLLILLPGCQGSVPTTEAVKDTVTPPMLEPSLTPLPTAGQVRVDSKGIEQVWVPEGSFLMGTDEASIQELMGLNPPGFVAGEFALEQPQHEVRITQGYWIDQYEVTNKAFQAFVADGGYTNQALWSAEGWEWLGRQFVDQLPRYCLGNEPDNPVACITWFEAEAYAHWRGGQLPTEAEWEYAARGPQSFIYPWGNEFDGSRCNVVDGTGLKPVGSYPTGASWVGAQDMAGNVMEWVQDWLGSYSAEAVENPTGPATGTVKVEKGGWWGGTFFVARSAYRHFEDPPDYGDMHIGFRVVSP